MFCLDPYVLVDRPFQPQRPFYYIPDITGGKEDIALSCVNEIDSTAPPKVAYSKSSTETAFGSVLDSLSAVKYVHGPQSEDCFCTSFRLSQHQQY